MSDSKLILNPCRKCGSRKIQISDCGYSSFNVGTIKCEDCGRELTLNNCSCFPEDELISYWNSEEERIKKKIKELRKTANNLQRDLISITGKKLEVFKIFKETSLDVLFGSGPKGLICAKIKLAEISAMLKLNVDESKAKKIFSTLSEIFGELDYDERKLVKDTSKEHILRIIQFILDNCDDIDSAIEKWNISR